MSALLLLSTPLAGDALPGGLCPSLSAITLGSHVRRAGQSVEVFDPSVDLDGATDPKELLDRVVDAALARKPEVIGLCALSPVEGRFSVAFARRAKARSPETPVVIGGIWATACAKEIVERVPEVDAVLAGAGEEAAVMLARDGLAHREEIPGLTWNQGGTVRQNRFDETPAEPAPVDLSLLSHPERYDIFCWLTSRGCPYHCAFCTEQLTSPRFVHDPLDKVAADVAAFEAVDRPWYLWICDPLFGVKRKRLAQVCDLLKGNDLEFLAESRVDVMHPDDLPMLREAGCNFIYFGLEAGGHRSLAELDKVSDSAGRYRRYVEGAHALVEACLRNDVLPVMGVLNPVPGDTAADLEETLELVQDLAGIARRLGKAANGLGPCFHAFPLRFDQGAPYDSRDQRLRAMGVTFNEPPDPLFGDRFIAGASPELDEAAAEAFRGAVRALNPQDDYVKRRLWRSFPRPYVEFEV